MFAKLEKWLSELKYRLIKSVQLVKLFASLNSISSNKSKKIIISAGSYEQALYYAHKKDWLTSEVIYVCTYIDLLKYNNEPLYLDGEWFHNLAVRNYLNDTLLNGIKCVHEIPQKK